MFYGIFASTYRAIAQGGRAATCGESPQRRPFCFCRAGINTWPYQVKVDNNVFMESRRAEKNVAYGFQARLFDEMPASEPPEPYRACHRCACCEWADGECVGECGTAGDHLNGGGWIHLRLTMARLRYMEGTTMIIMLILLSIIPRIHHEPSGPLPDDPHHHHHRVQVDGLVY